MKLKGKCTAYATDDIAVFFKGGKCIKLTNGIHYDLIVETHTEEDKSSIMNTEIQILENTPQPNLFSYPLNFHCQM